MPPQTATDNHAVSADVTISGRNLEIHARVTVPAGPVQVGQLLPLARLLADAVVQAACDAAASAGTAVSCKKGCGACCNSLVAISEVEARRIGKVLDQLPPSRGAEIRARFAEARRRLLLAGLLEALLRPEDWTAGDYQQLVGSYFQQRIPCPFLEAGSCSIYAERPITCREYLVTSPAALCARPGSAGVRLVHLPLRVFNAVARWQTPPPEHLMERVVALIVAPEWAAAHPDDPPPRPGPELLRELLGHLHNQADSPADNQADTQAG